MALKRQRYSKFLEAKKMRWDLVSAVLTVAAMLAVGQKKWQGWGLAFLNSVAVCILAVHVAPKQWALIPTNVFCLVIYTRNLIKWQRDGRRSKASQPMHRRGGVHGWRRTRHEVPAGSDVELAMR